MKKRFIMAALAAALTISQGMSVFAAGSIHSGSSVDSDYDIGKRNEEVWGTKAGNSQNLTVENGDGRIKVSLATGEAATAGLPEQVVSSIQSINSGAALDTATGNTELAGYKTLTGTQAVVTRSAADDQVVTGQTEISIYVPNLTSSLNNVQILFYDNATGRWSVLAPVSVDMASKTVRVNINGSGTFAVVYK